MKKVPDVIISYYPLKNELKEYRIWVGVENTVLLYVYSKEDEDLDELKDWTCLWWDSINKKTKKKVLN